MAKTFVRHVKSQCNVSHTWCSIYTFYISKQINEKSQKNCLLCQDIIITKVLLDAIGENSSIKTGWMNMKKGWRPGREEGSTKVKEPVWGKDGDEH
jgi:hypothetical protein